MKCFVIMPFGNPDTNPELARKFELIYSQWIKPTVEAISVPGSCSEKIRCHRADKDFGPGEIINSIIENLIDSDIVIADLTGKSPNVFYELGARHAVSNNTILIAEDQCDIPFDLRGMRAILYRYDPENMMKFKHTLESAVKEITSNPDKIDNPVRRYLYNRESDKIIKQTTPPGYNIVKNVLSEMADMRREFDSHFTDVRNLMNLIVSTTGRTTDNISGKELTIEAIQGIWIDTISKSAHYARVKDGRLYVAYCYGDNDSLTGHFINCTLMGDILFAQFKWIVEPQFSGNIYLRMTSINTLDGGWWFDRDTPYSYRIDPFAIGGYKSWMRKMILERDKKAGKCPNWAEKYFRSSTH